MNKARDVALSVYAAIIAFSAYAGAAGLAGGGLDTSGTLDDRLPFHSPVFGAIALTLVVAVPSSILAVLAWRGDPRTSTLAMAVGALLVGWIALETAILAEFSWLQPFYAAVGAGLVLIGFRGRRSGRVTRRDEDGAVRVMHESHRRTADCETS